MDHFSRLKPSRPQLILHTRSSSKHSSPRSLLGAAISFTMNTKYHKQQFWDGRRAGCVVSNLSSPLVFITPNTCPSYRSSDYLLSFWRDVMILRTDAHIYFRSCWTCNIKPVSCVPIQVSWCFLSIVLGPFSPHPSVEPMLIIFFNIIHTIFVAPYHCIS